MGKKLHFTAAPAAVAAGMLSLLASAAYAQTAPAASNKETKLEEIFVTGTHIRRTDSETPSPVQVVSRADIEKSGLQNIADVIRTVSADNQGSLPTAFTAGFAAGAAGVSLRGLGLNSTLVLVNGRRMATYGLADDGSRTFVDLNSIPLEAVDHVDVLKDSGSAIYGSDAVAGVVNIVLKNSFEGASMSGNIGTSYADDGNQWRLSASIGHGNLASDRYNVFLTAEASGDGMIMNSNRSKWLGTSDLRPYDFYDMRQGAPNTFFYGLFAPGHSAFSSSTPYGAFRIPGGTPWQRHNVLACPEVSPATSVCLYDRIGYNVIQPQEKRQNVFARGVYQFNDSVQGYLELGWFNSKVFSIGTPGGVNDTGVFNPADPLNPVTPAHTTVLPIGHPDNPYAARRTLSLLTTMLGGRNTSTDSTVTRFIAGLKGDIGTWKYDAAIGYIDSSLKREQTGFIYWPAFNAAVQAGTFRVDPALDSQALLAQISPTLRDNPTSSVTLADATVSGSLATLPGGDLGMAVGLEYRKEKSDAPPVPFTDTGDIVGLGYSAFSADRNVSAAYVELTAPLVKSLELNAAYRYDKYSDYGNSSTPKFGIKWTPLKGFSLRGTYAEAFRAPGPTESGKSASLGFTNIAIITLGDPHVKPETAKSYTLGVILEPFKGSSVSVDYYRIERKNEITPADQGSIVAGLPITGVPLSKIPGAQPDSFLYYDIDGNLATISGPYSNLNKTTTSGFDIDLRQNFDLAGMGKLDAGLIWTHVQKYERVLSDGTTFEYAGTQGPYVLSSAGGTPVDRAALDLTWSRSKYQLTARLNYVSGMKLIDHKGESLLDLGDGTFTTTTFEYFNFVANPSGIVCAVYTPSGQPFNGNCTVPSFTTVDFHAKVDMSANLELNASVTNAFNTIAPFNPYTYGGKNYNPAFTQDGAVGRFMRLGFKYKF
jgi:iron complex outermembrane recepter protein